MASKKQKLDIAKSPKKLIKKNRKLDPLEAQAVGVNTSDDPDYDNVPDKMNTTGSMDPNARTSIVKTVKDLRKNSTSRSHNTNFIKENNDLNFSGQGVAKRPTTEDNPNRPISAKHAMIKASTTEETKDNKSLVDKKKFIIGGPSNYDKMKAIRDKKKEEAKSGKVIVPPNPVEAFETMLRRSKHLREYFEQHTDEDFAMKYMSKNWHFLTSFEYFLFQMVKDGEITKEFNNLTKAVANKIEKFVIEKVDNYLNFSDLDKSLKTHNSKINKAVRELASKKQSKKNQYENYFANYYIEPQS